LNVGALVGCGSPGAVWAPSPSAGVTAALNVSGGAAPGRVLPSETVHSLLIDVMSLDCCPTNVLVSALSRVPGQESSGQPGALGPEGAAPIHQVRCAQRALPMPKGKSCD